MILKSGQIPGTTDNTGSVSGQVTIVNLQNDNVFKLPSRIYFIL